MEAATQKGLPLIPMTPVMGVLMALIVALAQKGLEIHIQIQVAEAVRDVPLKRSQGPECVHDDSRLISTELLNIKGTECRLDIMHKTRESTLQCMLHFFSFCIH